MKTVKFIYKDGDAQKALEAMLDDKSDREVAILAAGVVEGMLYDLLQHVIVESSNKFRGNLFSYKSQLGSFGDMVAVAYAFGIVSEIEYGVLRAIQSIRNLAAHNVGFSVETEFSFAEPEIKTTVLNVWRATGTSPTMMFNLESAYDEKPVTGFCTIFCLAEECLKARRAAASRIPKPTEYDYQ